MIIEGQRNDINFAIPLLKHVNLEGSNILADRGYDSDKLIDYIYEQGGDQQFHPEREQSLNVIAIGGYIKSGI